MTELIYNGKSTKDFGVWISGSGVWGAPERDVEHIEVPGRNGDLTIDNKRFKNLPVVYPAFIARGFDEKFDMFRAFMASSPGYHRLTDSYHPAEYRLAEFYQAIEPAVGTLNRSGRFDLSFYCKPQRFLIAGESTTTLTGNGQINNPTLFEAKPLLRVYGTGSFTIGDDTVTISNANDYTDIDCDIEDAFKGAENLNENIQLSSGNFPVLKPGNNSVLINGIAKIDIVPRWYTI